MKSTLLSFVWPKLLERPPGDALLVYLDLNHWIGLAQASIGHPQGRSIQVVLNACRDARSRGKVVFVLSATIYAEVQKIKDPAQRRALAQVMEELTNFATLTSRAVIMELELSAVLDQFAKMPSPLMKIPLVGRGVRHAFGLSSEIAVMSPAGDETDRLRREIGPQEFDRVMNDLTTRRERSILRGPADHDEEQALRTFGWYPEGPQGITENRASQERELKVALDSESRWRRGRLRDVISARELEIEFQNILPRALQERELDFVDVFTGQESARLLVRAMPSTEVSIEIKTAWHRNGEKDWTVNDIHDIDALAVATPYCDVVVTEKACHHILQLAGIPARMDTALLHNLGGLPQALTERQPKRRP